LSGFAIGSQHKIAGLTGAAYTVEKIEQFGRGRYGKATIRVGDKDREGYVHEIGVDDGQPDGLLVAELHIDATALVSTGRIVSAFEVPKDATIAKIADKRAKKNGKNIGSAERPTKEMEAISAYWEEKINDIPARTQNKTVDMIRDRQQNTHKPQMSRDKVKGRNQSSG